MSINNKLIIKILIILWLVSRCNSGLCEAKSPEAGTKKITVAAVGDIMLGRHLGQVFAGLEKEGKDPYGFPFERVKDVLKNVDIAIGNLEAPFTRRGVKLEKKFNFRVDPEYVQCLARAGIGMVNLANNHVMDFGPEGILDTFETLEEAGIKFSGAGRDAPEARKPAIIEVNGVKVAFLGYSKTLPMAMNAGREKPGVAFGYPEWIKKDVSAAKIKADYVIVSFHWGGDRYHRIKEYQRDCARLAIDSGADAVIGHHPHVLQGIEVYRGKVIAYSLGNFVFGGNRSGKITESMLLLLDLDSESISYRVVPVDIAKVLFQPQVMEGARGKELVEKIKAYSVEPVKPH